MTKSRQIESHANFESIAQPHLMVDDENARKRRGTMWVLGSFIFCPCHLPLTLGVIVALLSGTALGTVVLHYSLLVGALITVLWLAGTWYGFRQLRARQTCAISS